MTTPAHEWIRRVSRPHAITWVAGTLFAMVGGCAGDRPAPTAGATLVLHQVARGRSDSVDMDRPLIIRSGPAGLIYVGVERLSGLPMVLDSTAHLVRLLGSRGPGPGEFETVSQVFAKADSVVVGDIRGELSLFGPGGNFVRTLPLTVTTVGQTILLRGDTLLLAEPIFSGDRFGLPLHLLAPTGDTVRSFGATDRSVDRRVMSRLVRHMAPATDSTIWVARHDRYQIERWHMNGTRLETLTLDRDWFPPLEADWDGGTSKPYPTVLRDIHQDRSGHLVVILERARPGSPTMPGAGGHESGVTTSLVERLASLEQVIEVLDADTGALIASTPGPRDVFLMRSLEDDRIVGIGTDPSGRDLPVVYAAILRSRTQRHLKR
jgi:hypothetical protein